MQAPDETVMVFLCGNTGRDDRVKVKNRQYRQGGRGLFRFRPCALRPHYDATILVFVNDRLRLAETKLAHKR